MSKYIKSHSSFFLNNRHQSTKDGTIYEKEQLTVNGISEFSNVKGQTPIFRDGNFMLTTRYNRSTSRSFTPIKWSKNTYSGSVWTSEVLDNYPDDKNSNDATIDFKFNYYSLKDFSYFGSCAELIRSSLSDISNKFPAEMYVSTMQGLDASGKMIETGIIDKYYVKGGLDNAEYNDLGDATYKYVVSNPFDINIINNVVYNEVSDNDRPRYFSNGEYLNYDIIDETGATHPISAWTSNQRYYYLNDKDNQYAIYNGDSLAWAQNADYVEINGEKKKKKKCFNPGDECAQVVLMTSDGKTMEIHAFMSNDSNIVLLVSSDFLKYHIRPNYAKYESFIDGLDRFEKLLFRTDTVPLYKSVFEIVKEERTHIISRQMRSFVFPIGDGGYNIDITSQAYLTYAKSLADIALDYDNLYCDNIYRSMTHEAIKNMDWTYAHFYNASNSDDDYQTPMDDISKVIRLWGREFDEIKYYIDNISTINSLSYQEEGTNMPDYFISDSLENDGWDLYLPYTKTLSEFIEINGVQYARNIDSKTGEFTNTFGNLCYDVDEKNNIATPCCENHTYINFNGTIVITTDGKAVIDGKTFTKENDGYTITSSVTLEEKYISIDNSNYFVGKDNVVTYPYFDMATNSILYSSTTISDSQTSISVSFEKDIPYYNYELKYDASSYVVSSDTKATGTSLSFTIDRSVEKHIFPTLPALTSETVVATITSYTSNYVQTTGWTSLPLGKDEKGEYFVDPTDNKTLIYIGYYPDPTIDNYNMGFYRLSDGNSYQVTRNADIDTISLYYKGVKTEYKDKVHYVRFSLGRDRLDDNLGLDQANSGHIVSFDATNNTFAAEKYFEIYDTAWTCSSTGATKVEHDTIELGSDYAYAFTGVANATSESNYNYSTDDTWYGKDKIDSNNNIFDNDGAPLYTGTGLTNNDALYVKDISTLNDILYAYKESGGTYDLSNFKTINFKLYISYTLISDSQQNSEYVVPNQINTEGDNINTLILSRDVNIWKYISGFSDSYWSGFYFDYDEMNHNYILPLGGSDFSIINEYPKNLCYWMFKDAATSVSKSDITESIIKNIFNITSYTKNATNVQISYTDYVNISALCSTYDIIVIYSSQQDNKVLVNIDSSLNYNSQGRPNCWIGTNIDFGTLINTTSRNRYYLTQNGIYVNNVYLMTGSNPNIIMDKYDLGTGEWKYVKETEVNSQNGETSSSQYKGDNISTSNVLESSWKYSKYKRYKLIASAWYSVSARNIFVSKTYSEVAYGSPYRLKYDNQSALNEVVFLNGISGNFIHLIAEKEHIDDLPILDKDHLSNLQSTAKTRTLIDMGYFYINSATVKPSNFNFYISGTTWDGTSIPEYSADVALDQPVYRLTEEQKKNLFTENSYTATTYRDIPILGPYDKYVVSAENKDISIQTSSYTEDVDSTYYEKESCFTISDMTGVTATSVPIIREFADDGDYEFTPYTKTLNKDYEDGYFYTKCCKKIPSSGLSQYTERTPYIDYDGIKMYLCNGQVTLDGTSYSSTFFADSATTDGVIGRVEELSAYVHNEISLYNVIKPYSDSKTYTSANIDYSFLKNLRLNSRYLLNGKGTVESVCNLLGLFGLKSKKWYYGLTQKQQASWGFYDYDIKEYTCIVPKIQDAYSDLLGMGKIAWYNQTKLITSENSSESEYYGLPVTAYTYYKDASGNITTDAYDSDYNLNKEDHNDLYPYFDSSKTYDGETYFQMNGGWMPIYPFVYGRNNEIVLPYEGIDGKMKGLYSETVRNFLAVGFLPDLVNINANTLIDGQIVEVSNLKDSYVILNGIMFDIYTDKWILTINGEKKSYDCSYINLYVQADNTIKVGDVVYSGTTYVSDPMYYCIDNYSKEEAFTREIQLDDYNNGYQIRLFLFKYDYVNGDKVKVPFNINSDSLYDASGNYNCDITLYDSVNDNTFDVFKQDDTVYSHYFLIKDITYSTILGNEGWKHLKNTDPEAIRAARIDNYFKANNPHSDIINGYDGGYEYISRFNQLFKYPINNDLFNFKMYGYNGISPYEIELENSLSKVGFDNLDTDSSVTIDLRDNYNEYVDSKIHFFGDMYKNKPSKPYINAFYDYINGSATTLYGLSDSVDITKEENIWRYGKKKSTDTSVSVYNLYNVPRETLTIRDVAASANSCYVSSADDTDYHTERIINTKVLDISFRTGLNLYTKSYLERYKYIDDVLIKYLQQLVPSTCICRINYGGNSTVVFDTTHIYKKDGDGNLEIVDPDCGHIIVNPDGITVEKLDNTKKQTPKPSIGNVIDIEIMNTVKDSDGLYNKLTGITFNTTPVNISASSNEYNTVVNSDSVYATDRLGNIITGSSNIIIKSNESISFTLDNIGSADCLSFTIDKKGTFNHPTTGGSYSGDAYMDSSETSDMYNITDISFVDGSTGNSLYINGVKTAVTGDKYFALTPSADNITSFSGNQENEGDSWNIVSVNHLNTSKIDDMSYSFANQTYLTTINSSFEHCTNFTSTFLMCTALTNITSACTFKDVEDGTAMFSGDTSLISFPDTITFDKVKIAGSMFGGCNNLIHLPSGLTGTKIVRAVDMFNSCGSLKSIPDTFDLPNAVEINRLFDYCSNLIHIPIMNVTNAIDGYMLLVARCYKLEDFGFTGMGNPNIPQGACGIYLDELTSVSDTTIYSIVYTMNKVQDRSSVSFPFVFYLKEELYNKLKSSIYYTGTDTQYDTFRNVMNNKNNYQVVAQ